MNISIDYFGKFNVNVEFQNHTIPPAPGRIIHSPFGGSWSCLHCGSFPRPRCSAANRRPLRGGGAGRHWSRTEWRRQPWRCSLEFLDAQARGERRGRDFETWPLGWGRKKLPQKFGCELGDESYLSVLGRLVPIFTKSVEAKSQWLFNLFTTAQVWVLFVHEGKPPITAVQSLFDFSFGTRLRTQPIPHRCLSPKELQNYRRDASGEMPFGRVDSGRSCPSWSIRFAW